MTKRLVMALVACASCSNAADSATAKGAAPNEAPAAACADAAACETGCAAGRLADCHELAWRKIGARGTPIDVAGAEKLLARACAGKLVRSCGMAAWVAASRGEELAAARRSELDRSCRAGDGWSCAGLASWALRPASPGGRGARDTAGGATWAELGCTADHIWSCATLEVIIAQVRPAPDWTAAMRERHSKLQAMIDRKRGAACAAGKREGCREGTPEYMALVRRDCAAGDHGACAELVYHLEDAAERQRAALAACEHGRLTEMCGVSCDGMRDGAIGPPDLAAARACYQRTCAAGEATACERRDAGPLLGGGCAAIDIAREPHLNHQRLPRLRGSRRGGGTFDSGKLDRKKRIFVFTASWNAPGTVAELEPLAADLAGLRVELIAVLSDTGWDHIDGLEDARSFTAVLDPPAAGGVIGGYTSSLGISKVPEAFLVDETGAVRRHIVGSRLITDRLNSRRCVEDVLGAATSR